MTPYYRDSHVTLYHGDCRDVMPRLEPGSVHCCVTSPPYWGLRDYGNDRQIGLEQTPEKYVAEMVAVFREVRRVLRDDGTLWLNLGDSYTSGMRGAYATDRKYGRARASDSRPPTPPGLDAKQLVGIPWRVAFALQADGWYLRQDIIWHKPNPMPESVTDRCTKAHEYIFLLSKSARYYYDAESVKEPVVSTGYIGLGRNRRSVWTIATQPYSGAHFATFPPKLIEPCILAGCPEGGTVVDPFFGAGTTGLVVKDFNRRAIGIELEERYCEIAARRLAQEVLPW